MRIGDLFKQISDKLQEDSRNTLLCCLSQVNDNTIEDWESYCQFSEEGYTRNLIFTNEVVDCFLLCWLPNQQTSYHYHPDRGCIYKVLDGSLEETKPLTSGKIEHNIFHSGMTSYIDNSQGFHMMKNTSQVKTVSLHFYAPSKFYN